MAAYMYVLVQVCFHLLTKTGNKIAPSLFVFVWLYTRSWKHMNFQPLWILSTRRRVNVFTYPPNLPIADPNFCAPVIGTDLCENECDASQASLPTT